VTLRDCGLDPAEDPIAGLSAPNRRANDAALLMFAKGGDRLIEYLPLICVGTYCEPQ
jgi:hypothetical protein